MEDMGDMEDMTEKCLLVASNLQSFPSEEVRFYRLCFCQSSTLLGANRQHMGGKDWAVRPEAYSWTACV